MNKMSTTTLTKPRQKTCIAWATQIIGDKWTPMLLFALADQSHRFGELQVAVGGINPRTLSARLDMLEQNGIIARAVHAEVPPRVEYSLTQMGEELLPVIQGMIDWGDKYQCDTNSK